MKDAMTDHKAEWVLTLREPTPEMVKAGTLGGLLTPNLACASFQAAMTAAPEPSLSGGAGAVSNSSEATTKSCAIGSKSVDAAASEGEDGFLARGASFRFGLGAWAVNTGTHAGEPCVFIDDAPTRGIVGAPVPKAEYGVPRLRLLFPTHEQAKSVQMALTTTFSAQVAATPKHDEGRIVELEAEIDRLRHWNESVSVCPKHTSDIVSFDGCVLCALDEYDPPTAALATQPAARRVTDGSRVAELIAADREFDEATAQHHSISATVEQIARLNAAVMRRRAALASFAQPPEGVSGE